MQQPSAMAARTLIAGMLAGLFQVDGVHAASQLAHPEAFPNVPNPNVSHLQRKDASLEISELCKSKRTNAFRSGLQPHPAYMMDNTNNAFGVAPCANGMSSRAALARRPLTRGR